MALSIETLLSALISDGNNMAARTSSSWVQSDIRNLLAACRAAKYSYVLSGNKLGVVHDDEDTLLVQVDDVIERLQYLLQQVRTSV